MPPLLMLRESMQVVFAVVDFLGRLPTIEDRLLLHFRIYLILQRVLGQLVSSRLSPSPNPQASQLIRNSSKPF